MTPKATFPTSPVPRATASSRASRTATEPPRSLESCEDAADRALHPRRVPRAFFTSHVGGVRPPEGCQKRRNPNPPPVNRERAGVCLAVARQQSTPRPRHAPSCQAPTKARPHQRPMGPPRKRRRTPHARLRAYHPHPQAPPPKSAAKHLARGVMLMAGVPHYLYGKLCHVPELAAFFDF